MRLPIGLYEQIISQAIGIEIVGAQSRNLKAEKRELDDGDSHEYLTQYIAACLSRALRSFPAQARLEKQLDLTNKVIDLLTAQAPEAFDVDNAKVMRAELLLAIFQVPIERPDTPLSASCLMTGRRQDPSLVSQLRKETN